MVYTESYTMPNAKAVPMEERVKALEGGVIEYTYLLIRGDEDGKPVTFLDAKGLKHLLEDPGYYGVAKFITREELETDPKAFSNSISEFEDPGYWKDDVALLVKLEIAEPKPKTSVTEWVIEE